MGERVLKERNERKEERKREKKREVYHQKRRRGKGKNGAVSLEKGVRVEKYS